MQILQVTLWIYATALMRAFDCVRKNLVVSLAPLAYSLVLSAAAMIALPLGILGGFLLGLVSQACISSGLYLVKNFVTLLGGSVSVRSTVGEGTTFTVRIPIGTAAGFLDDDAVAANITATGVVSSSYLEGGL